jgi:4'-phosphopantetheinyl transferase
LIDILFLHGLPAPDDAETARWLTELPPALQQRLSRLRVRNRLLQSLAGLHLLRHLAHARGVGDFRLEQIQTTELGKPHVEGLGDFSISHDEDLVACALTDEGRVGLDVEKVRSIKIAHFARVFTAAELDWIDDDERRFFDLWTRKEAAVKVSGEHGIGHMQSVNVEHTQARLDGADLNLHPLTLVPDYTACLASDAPIDDIRIRRAVADATGLRILDTNTAATKPDAAVPE